MDDSAAGLGGEVVLEGAHADMTWQIRASGDAADLSTMLYLYRGEQMLEGSGMGGPSLEPGELIAHSRGYSDRTPWHILVRTDPSVTFVVATTRRGAKVPVSLSPVVQPYGLRFGVALLPAGDGPGSLAVETADGVVDEQATLAPPALPPGTTSGWIPL